MAEEFLEVIYRESILRTKLKCLLKQLLSDNDGIERRNYPQIMLELDAVSKKYVAMNPEDGMGLYNDLRKLQEYNNRHLELSDFIEANILPQYEKYLSRLNKICVDDGLGYTAYQLYCISDGSVPIKIYEYEERMVQYARRYGVLDWIPEECISVTVNADVLPFLYSLEQEEGYGYYIFEPEIYQAPEDAREIVRTLFINGNTSAAYREAQRRNFYRNIQSDARPLPCFHKDNLGDRFILVAGGPSVDDGLDFLKQQEGKMPIIAIGAIFSKLLSCGIAPDMVTILDPNPITMKQLEGVTDQQVPLFLGITAYWKLARSYKGEKYLVPIDGDTPEQKLYAERCGGIALECPGTVTMLAVSLALYFGAKEVYLLGADFAFSKDKYYATGATGGGSLDDKSGLFKIESVGGGLVNTDKSMSMFRGYMEELIENTLGVTFYNLSKGGARIAGTVEI